ncbi:MAG: ABC transporter ATP-binding protein [Protaetiibacter sp.]
MIAPKLLEVRGLHVDFRSGEGWTEVVHGIDFEIAEGEVVALVGESGSGKSVSAMSIADLLPRNARRRGSIRFAGEELVNTPEPRMRALRGDDIAVIFQEPMTALNPVYTIGAQLVEAILSHRQISASDAHARAIELLRQVEMPHPEEFVRRYPHQISGGQRQRAMIAMAVSAEPRLLIADEPTTALDVTVQAEILDLLLSLRDRLGMGVLVITHDMGVVADVADRVIVMAAGEVVEQGESRALFAHPEHPYTQALLAAVPSIDENSAGTRTASSPEATPVAELENVRLSYRRGWRTEPLVAVDDVTLRIGEGEVVGLVGESGSGKSTIGRIVLGLARPQEGTVRTVGTDIARASAPELRRMRRDVSVVFQDPGSSLNPRHTIGRSITDPLRWTGIERRSSELHRIAGELLERVRIPASWVDRFPHELSGGQRQRVGIARAIATRPRLMVADEPTSALDVSVQAAVLDLLLELQSSMGFSCLFISHDLAVVDRIANRVVVLKSGRLVEEGPTAQLLRHPSMPYTKALIAAVPIPDPVRQRARRASRLARGA